MSLWPVCPIQLTLLSFQSETSWCICQFSTKNIDSDSRCRRVKSGLQALSQCPVWSDLTYVFSHISDLALLQPRGLLPDPGSFIPGCLWSSVSFPDHVSLSCSACLDLTIEYHSNAPSLKPWDDFLLATPEAHFTQPANQHFTFSCLVEHTPLLITIYPWSLSSTEPYMCSDRLRVITVWWR